MFIKANKWDQFHRHDSDVSPPFTVLMEIKKIRHRYYRRYTNNIYIVMFRFQTLSPFQVFNVLLVS